jgi:5'(3')-deoxyribonucleotidase
MSRPVVLLDIDGVVANFIEANLRWLRSIGIDRQHDDVTSWDFGGLGLEPSILSALKRQWSEPGFCASIPPYEGARDGVEALRRSCAVYAVTAPMWSGLTWQGERMEWLVGHFGFRRDHIVSTAAKYLIAGDVLIDDKPSTVESWGFAHPMGCGVVWAQPYNADWHSGHRVGNWAQLIDIAHGGYETRRMEAGK